MGICRKLVRLAPEELAWLATAYMATGNADGSQDAALAGTQLPSNSEARKKNTCAHQQVCQKASSSSSIYYVDMDESCLLSHRINLEHHPTYVDSGCTRAMGSRCAVDRLVRACQQQACNEISLHHEPTHSKFVIANSETAVVKGRLVMTLKHQRVLAAVAGSDSAWNR